MSLVLQSSGGGSVTLEEPTTASNFTISMPAVTGTMLTTASAGTVLQVVQGTYATQVNNATNTFVDTGIEAIITPNFTTSKIMVIASCPIYVSRATNNTGASLQITRSGSAIFTQTDNMFYVGAVGASSLELIGNPVMQILDSPASTSALTYKLQVCVENTGGTFALNNNPVYLNGGTDVYHAGYTSTITAIEVAA